MVSADEMPSICFACKEEEEEEEEGDGDGDGGGGGGGQGATESKILKGTADGTTEAAR